MSFRMVTPRRSESGSVKARKVIPKDVRAEYQSLYGVSAEAKLTVSAGTPAHEVKILVSDFLAEVETRIATIRAAQRGEGQSLSQRQAFALAGEWYVWYVGRHEENPGTAEHWHTMWDVLILELESHASPEVHEKPWKDLEWTRDPEVRAGIRPVIADEGKTAQFLASKGVVLTTDAQALFLDAVLDEFIAAILISALFVAFILMVNSSRCATRMGRTCFRVLFVDGCLEARCVVVAHARRLRMLGSGRVVPK